MSYSSHRAVAVAVALLTLAGVAIAGDNSTRKAPPNPGVPTVAATPLGPGGLLGGGTATFDNDTPFRRDGTDGGTVGNRFEVNDPNPPHSIATVSFAAAGNFSTSMVMTVWDVNPGSAMVLARQLVTGIPQGPMTDGRFSAMLAAPIVGHNGSFIAGLRNTDYTPCIGNQALASTCDGVALTQGAAGGGGPQFRAARINFTSGAFVPTIQMVNSTGADIAGINAIFRVTGDNLPVELMHFEVE